MSPIVGYHATRRVCRESIQENGLLPWRPKGDRPYGIYVYRDDDSFNHAGWKTRTVWEASPRSDVWEASYIGPLMIDQYVLNALIFLAPVEHVTLVAGNDD